MHMFFYINSGSIAAEELSGLDPDGKPSDVFNFFARKYLLRERSKDRPHTLVKDPEDRRKYCSFCYGVLSVDSAAMGKKKNAARCSEACFTCHPRGVFLCKKCNIPWHTVVRLDLTVEGEKRVDENGNGTV